jgi:glycosyltransferase involved in cell wall biosynthesis
MITGDKNLLKPGTETYGRFKLQRSQVDELAVVYFGLGSLWPKIPKGKFEVVTTQDPFWRGLVAWRIARRINARLNVQVHTDLSAQTFSRRLIARIILRRADSVRVVSEKIKKQVEQIGVRVPISVLPIYIDPSRFAGLAHKQHPHFKKTILWVGRFEPEKNPLLALSILKQVRDAGVDAGLTMLGNGSLDSRLQKESTKLDLPAEFPGWQNPAEYLATADVVFSTSKHESFGASIVEALAAGVPVVAPDVGVAREAGAIVVSQEKLAEAIIKVLKSKVRGELKLTPPSAEEWAKRWKETL